MRGKSRFWSLVLTLALLAGLSLDRPASAANLYFIGLNDNVPPMTAGSMPFWSGGALFVPYTVFDANLNGSRVNLGLYTSYNRSNNTVTLFNLRQMLIFDLNDGSCRDEMTGTVYTSRAMMRGGQPYLSLSLVCSFFNLEYSYNQLPYISQGYLVRIKSADAVLDDSRFIDAARDLINTRLREYTQSLSPAETTDPVMPSTPPTTVPTVPVEPVPEETGDTVVYLAFRCESGESLGDILDALSGGPCYAVFFLTPQALEEEGDLVRRILGTGHSVGVLADGGEDVPELLARGSRALERAAQARTTLAYVPSGQRQGLEEMGWVCWRETALLSPDAGVSASAFASNALSRLGTRRTAYLTLEGNGNTVQVLPTLLRQLGGDHYSVAIPLETVL